MTEETNHISTVRQALLDTIKDLRDPKNPMDIARARAVSEVAQTVINSAKVEVDYLKATGQDCASFLAQKPDDAPRITNSGYTQGTVAHLPGGVLRHTLKG